MRKLSALIAMILCVSIGGVYAAWTYTNGAKDVADIYKAYTITLSTATEEGAHGVYTVETNITGLTIDQNGTADPNEDFHKAVLNYTTANDEAPYIRIVFDLADNAPDDATVFGAVNTTFDLRVIDVATQYAGQKIFKDPVGKVSITLDGANKWEERNAAERIFYYEIDPTQYIELNDFILKSKAEHTAFGAALGNPLVRIDVSDGKAADGSDIT